VKHDRALAVIAAALAGCSPRSAARDAATTRDDAAMSHGDVTPFDAASDAVHVDARTDARADAPRDAAPPPVGSVLYPLGRRHSPITAAVAARLAAIPDASSVANVFAKVGDSMTATTNFVACFDSGYDLATHTDLTATRSYFAGGNAGGTSPYARTSLAATGGWETRDELVGAPDPLDRELSALSPRYAVVLLGTNDNRYGRSLDAFGQDLWTIVDDAVAHHSIPILSTIAPVNGDPSSDARVPLFNLVVRAIAQGRQVPLVDFHDELVGLPSRGIGSDGLHPTVSASGACDLTAPALQYGYNVRNLITLEALKRTRDAVAGQAADASAPVRTGSGTHADPVVTSLPIADLADTRSGDDAFDVYPTCDSSTHAGREIVYALQLPSAQTIDAYVIDRGAVDVDVHILNGSLSASACVAGGDTSATATVGPGPVYVVVDSLAASTEGEYVLVVAPH
jgi:hypothetical protein